MAFVSPSLRGAFARFVEGLYEEACKNVGLSHAKVREYWIYRGPKWLLMTICLISGLLAVEEALGDPTHRERMARLASGVIAMTASCIMLYFKLPDSIRSSVARSTHDFYVAAKKAELKRRPTNVLQFAAGKADGRSDAKHKKSAAATDVAAHPSSTSDDGEGVDASPSLGSGGRV